MARPPIPCPCGGPSYEACCAPFHRGAEPTDPERVLRSRYSAYVKRDIEYLYRTAGKRTETRTFDEFARSLRGHFASGVSYAGLRILGARDRDEEGFARITFKVLMSRRGKPASFVETSLFSLEEGKHRYDGFDDEPVGDERA